MSLFERGKEPFRAVSGFIEVPFKLITICCGSTIGHICYHRVCVCGSMPTYLGTVCISMPTYLGTVCSSMPTYLGTVVIYKWADIVLSFEYLLYGNKNEIGNCLMEFQGHDDA